MAAVNGRPFLDHILHYLSHHGIKRVVLSTGYLGEKIEAHYGDHFKEMKISYSFEKEPMGTGGGIRLAIEQCAEKEILVLNGDSFFDVDIKDFYNKHQSSTADVSLALRSVENAARYGTIELADDNRIDKFTEKNGEEKEGLINAGIYIIKRNLFLEKTESGKNFSIEKDFFEKQLKALSVKGFVYNGYFIDIGIPEDYKKAQHDFKRFTY